MMDYQELRTRLVNCRASNSLDDYDEFCKLVTEYTAACKRLNEQLILCNKLLTQGLRGDALRQCEQEKLLENVAVLDIWTPDEWQAIAEQYQIDTPPHLASDIAADLDNAYIQETPLKTLLERHRFLALSRAPLATRVQIMRQIQAVEPDNVIATLDLPIFEEALFKQIIAKMKEADEKNDGKTFLQLNDQLTAEPWQIELSPQALRWVQNVYQKYRIQIVNEHLARLEYEMNIAFSEVDLERGRQLRNQWNEVLQQSGGLENPDIVQRARPALEWLRQDDVRLATLQKHRQAVFQLQNALDQQNYTYLSDLEKLHRNAISAGIPLDPYLERRYQQQMESEHRGIELRSRNRWIIAIVIVAIIVVTVSIIGVNHYNQRVLNDFTQNLQTCMEEYRLDDAQKTLEAFTQEHSILSGRDEAVQLAQELEQKQAEDKKRSEQLTKVMDLYRQSPSDGLAKQMTQLARNDYEKNAVLMLKNEASTQMRKEQEERDNAFMERVQGLTQRIVQLEKEDSPDADQLTSIAQELNQLENIDINNVSVQIRSGLQASLRPLQNRLDAMQRKANE